MILATIKERAVIPVTNRILLINRLVNSSFSEVIVKWFITLVCKAKLLAERVEIRMTALRVIKPNMSLQQLVHLTDIKITNKQLIEEIINLNKYAKWFQSENIEGIVNSYIVPAAKAARESKSKFKDIFLGISDTSGVTILSLVQEHASNQRISIQFEDRYLEFGARSGIISIKDIYQTMNVKPIVYEGR